MQVCDVESFHVNGTEKLPFELQTRVMGGAIEVVKRGARGCTLCITIMWFSSSLLYIAHGWVLSSWVVSAT